MHTKPIKSTCTPAHTHTAEKDMEGVGVKTNLKTRAVIKSKRESSRFVQQKSYYWSKYCLKR